MSSQNLSLVEGSSIDYSCEILSNKETQTSTTYITDSFALLKGPSRPLPKGIDKSKIKASVNVLDCKIIKDSSDPKTPDHDTERFIKEIVNSNVSISDDGEGSRLKSCTEVESYLNDNLNECEDNVDSLEQLIQDALKDLHDYQPCFEVYEGLKDIEEKISHTSTMNMESLKASNLNESSTKGSSTLEKCNMNSEDQSEPVSSRLVCRENIQSLVDSADKNVENETINGNTPKESTKKSYKDTFTALKCSASSCLEKIEYVIGVKRPENPNEKPTYYPILKPKVQSNASHNVQTETGNSLNNIKNRFDGHNEKITAIKGTFVDFAEKIYKTSKDAVTLIRSESAKLLSKGKTDNTVNTNEDKPKINLRKISANSIANLLFKRAENKPIDNGTSENETFNSSAKISETAPLSIKSQLIKIKDKIVDSRIDKSSPHDKVDPPEVSSAAPDPPESRIPTVSAIERTPEPPPASSMFTIIKSKIFSMFRDESNKNSESVQEQTNVPDDEEEDPFERFMEQ